MRRRIDCCERKKERYAQANRSRGLRYCAWLATSAAIVYELDWRHHRQPADVRRRVSTQARPVQDSVDILSPCTLANTPLTIIV